MHGSITAFVLAQPKCQSFADKFYATKTMVVYDAAMHLFGCKACPEVRHIFPLVRY